MKTFKKTVEIGLGILVVLLIMYLLNIGLSYIDGRQERIKELEKFYKNLDEIKIDTIVELEEELEEEVEGVVKFVKDKD
uniref:hypothetical protein n=1 Tax=uncultured Polaribacter sp. TaxID=174711 RepID=UPI00262FE898|nr:hypothetical protein [uncultured Polaribacter sp.]